MSGVFLFFKQKTAYEMRISDWSSDVCSSDLDARHRLGRIGKPEKGKAVAIADVEEEMLAAPAGQVDRLGQRHAELVAVEFDRLRHILAHEREVVDPAKLEFAIRCSHHPSP